MKKNKTIALLSYSLVITLVFILVPIFGQTTVQHVSAETCSGAWDVTVSGLKPSYQPGENIDIVVSFKARNPADCPGCVQQILVGMVDQNGKVVYVDCAYNGQAMACPNWTTGNKAISFKAPSVTGMYKIVAGNEYQYNCQDARNKFSIQPTNVPKEIASTNIIEAKVLAPTTPPPINQKSALQVPPYIAPAIIISVIIISLVLLLTGPRKRLKALKRFLIVILALAVLFILGYLFWTNRISAISNWFSQYLGTIITLVALAIAAIVVWRIRKTSKPPGITYIPKWTFEAHGMETDQQLRIWNSIKSCRLRKRCNQESDYKEELFRYLKGEFPQAEQQVRIGSSIIDIKIDRIAIEIKGPTRFSDFNRLKGQIQNYTFDYDLLYVVLFDPYFSDGQFEELKKGIRRDWPNDVGVITKPF